MKCISWNVNGIRAVLKKDFVEILYALDADIFCIQETKAQPDQIEVDCELYPQVSVRTAGIFRCPMGSAVFSPSIC